MGQAGDFEQHLFSSGLSVDRSLDAAELTRSPKLFERFPYGLAIGAPDGAILQMNHRARQLLVPDESAPMEKRWTCCELICDHLGSVLGTGCMSEWALGSPGELPEVRVDFGEDRMRAAAWVSASTLESPRRFVLFHLRPGRPNDRRRRTRGGWRGPGTSNERAELSVRTLGQFRIEGADGPVNGDWLEQRAGQLFKYLVCERRKTLASDQIAEALWPGAGTDDGRNRLRFHIHALREKIEPDRTQRSASRFVVGRRGGYLFDTSSAWIDADDFECEAKAGLGAIAQGNGEGAAPHLDRAAELYRGDFMVEDPYAEWALAERERLRNLCARVLRAQATERVAGKRLEAADCAARRLAELEPFDDEVQRLLLEISLRRGRRSEAVRRFELHRRRVQRTFEIEPGFDLRQVEQDLRRGDGEGLSSTPSGSATP